MFQRKGTMGSGGTHLVLALGSYMQGISEVSLVYRFKFHDRVIQRNLVLTPTPPKT